jgi:ribosomal protein S17
MQKSVLVAVDRLVKHKKYDRILKRTTKLMVRQDVTAV